MSPRLAAHLLGLCNVVAGALVVWAPAMLMPGVGGLGSPAAGLLGASLGVLLTAVGIGAWIVPVEARRTYLWMFGVGVKVVAAIIWAAAAMTTGVMMLAAGAVVDLAIASAITGLLTTSR